MRKFWIVLVSVFSVFSSMYAQNSMPISQKMANSQMQRSGFMSKWDYPNGLFAESLLRVYEFYQNDDYLNYVVRYADACINSSSGVINGYSVNDYNIDYVNPGMFVIRLQQIAPKSSYLTALNTVRGQLQNQPRINNIPDGGFWHKKIYPHQMWLDGLFMGSRFYAEFEKLYRDGAEYADIINQFAIIHSKTYDVDYQLNYHAWSAQPDDANSFWANQTDPFKGCSKEFWGRGLGWYMAALIDVIEILPETYGRRAELVDILHQVAAGVKRWQDPESGCWYQLLRYDSTFKSAKGRYNYIEASSSSMFTYALLKAIRLGVINETEYKPVAEKAYNGLLENFISEDASGNLSLNRICRSAGLGPASKQARDGSADYYLDGSDAGDIVSNDLKGVGPFIMASVEFEMTQDTGNSVEGVERNDNRIKVVHANRIISIISESQPVEYVECYNLSGSLVFSSKGNSQLNYSFESPDDKGVYIIRVNRQLVKRIVLN